MKVLPQVPDLPPVRTLQDAVDLFRVLKRHWGLTNDFCDHAGGLVEGHTDKVLGPSEIKRLGYDTFALFCEMFAVELHPSINMDAVKRMEAVWEGRKRPVELSDNSRISAKLIERAKPHVFSQMGKLSAPARMKCLTVEHRKKIARKAAKARWRKRSKKLLNPGTLLENTASPSSRDDKSASNS
jgi:hypothetical protein